MTSVATRTAALTKDYQYGFSDPEQYSFKSRRGLDRDVVEQISAHKQEPEWMLQFRLRALDIFQRKPVPTWPSADLSEIDFDNIFYYLRPTDNSAEKNWTTYHRISRRRSINSASRRQNGNFSQASRRNTSPKSSTTPFARTSKSRASSSSTWTPACGSIRTLSRSTSAR